jgi:crotonobetainyl-CoA:carnitine CoA-transferase CaiB-like acyl-CoA transferase
MERLGLGYEAVATANPRIVYAGMVGFSQRGRYAAEPAFDDLIQSACGLPHAQATVTDGVPRYLPITIADRSVGIYAFGVICAALFARQQTGRGQRVDIPMFETMVPYVLGDHLYGHTFIPPKGGFGYPRIMSPNRRPYRTKDGFVCCLVYTDRQWQTFLQAVGKGDWFETDPRFRDIRVRTAKIDELYQLVSDELQHRTTAEWCELLKGADIPLFPVHTFDSLLADPHLDDIGFFEEVEHPVAGRIRQTAVPSEWSDTVPGVSRPVPVLGQHSAEVLREAGLSDGDIAALVAARATAHQKEPS